MREEMGGEKKREDKRKKTEEERLKSRHQERGEM